MITIGGGSWNVNSYRAATQTKINTGTSFGYDAKVRQTGAYKAHTDLDPKRLAGPGSPFEGQIMRESRDNAEHPNSVPISILFDATGSMGNIPRVTQQKLSALFGLLLRRGYVDDPQIMVSAYGDAKTDYVPLQISQFESDNRIDENLDNLFLEGNGGGNGGESQSLGWYYLVNHTATDAWDKRHKKGYAFFIADEISHELTPQVIRDNIGVDEPVAPFDNASLAKAMLEKWDVYVLLIDNASAAMQGSERFYKKLFGEKHVLVVEDSNAITETIALTIGVMEGTVDFDDAADDLVAEGSNAVAVRSATNAVAPLKGLGGVGALAKGNIDLDINGSSGAARF